MIAGLGLGGSSVEAILKQRSAQIVTVDDKKAASYTFAQVMADDFDWEPVSLVVTSPGFSPHSDFLTRVAARGIPIISEVEFAWQIRARNPISGQPAAWIGITGTNGKTSTTEMTAEILQAASLAAPAVGNIGIPVSQAAVDENNQALVVELSSFQLHYTYSLQLEAAAITNLADDHLDWHGGFENYAADKARVYQHVKKALVYNADDPRVSQLARQARQAQLAQPAQLAQQAQSDSTCLQIGFTLGQPADGQVGIDQGWIVSRTPLIPQGRLAALTDFPHLTEPDGTVYPHLLADALCALCLSAGYGVPAQTALSALQGFAPGGHRIQKVAVYHKHSANPDPANSPSSGDIRFIDDSKATNAHAAAASLSSFPDQSVIWIAGGLSKGAHFDDLVAKQKKVIKAAVIIGQDQSQILHSLHSQAPDIPYTCIDPGHKNSIMKEAVAAAASYAQPGNVVLLAPACASMDQFASYADRGDQFASCAQTWVAHQQEVENFHDQD